MKQASIHWGNRKQPFLRKPSFKWKQVHGTRVAWPEKEQDVGEADGIAAQTQNEIISVVTADCVPILLASKKTNTLSALHAGWRGTLKNIVSHWAQAIEEHRMDPSDFQAWVGPCIKDCCYEVSPEIVRDFQNEFPMIDTDLYLRGARNINLAALNAELLKGVGVQDISIHSDCTYCAADPGNESIYYSYRRGDRDSRQFSSIYWSPL